MNSKAIATLLALSLSTMPLLTGCASDESEAAESAEQDIVAPSDAAIKRELAEAIVGLETTGSEGDPDPYKVVDLKLRRGEQMTNDVLLARLLPKLRNFEHEEIRSISDYVPGLDEQGLGETWTSLTEEPNAADYEDDAEGLAAARAQAVKWRRVKQIFESKLTNVRSFDMGYRYGPDPTGSLETGIVAHVLIGQTSTGRVIAIYGTVVWT